MIRGRSLCALLAYVLSVLVWPHLAWSETSIARGGDTVVTAKLRGSDLKVRVHTVDLGRDHECAALAIDSRPSGDTSVVVGLIITLNGMNVHVPRSAFADITQPAAASIKAEGSAFRLSISGGDASEAYFVEIDFDAEKVTKRRLFSLLTPTRATEETRYRLTTLKDE